MTWAASSFPRKSEGLSGFGKEPAAENIESRGSVLIGHEDAAASDLCVFIWIEYQQSNEVNSMFLKIQAFLYCA
jgi:hypothetical protein